MQEKPEAAKQQLEKNNRSDELVSGDRIERRGRTKPRSRLTDSRMIEVPHCPAEAFWPIQRIGGETGWYYGNWLWRLREFLDMLVGGVGMRRGRPDPERLAPGDTLDCWRVEVLQPNRFLRLVAEMRLPGRAWLQFEVLGHGASSTIRQTAIFDAAGILGWLYWYVLYPVHRLMFAGMLRGIVKAIPSCGESCACEK